MSRKVNTFKEQNEAIANILADNPSAHLTSASDLAISQLLQLSGQGRTLSIATRAKIIVDFSEKEEKVANICNLFRIKVRSDDGRIYLIIKRKPITSNSYVGLIDKLYEYFFGLNQITLETFFPDWQKWRDEDTSVSKKTVKENYFLWNALLKDDDILKFFIIKLFVVQHIPFFLLLFTFLNILWIIELKERIYYMDKHKKEDTTFINSFVLLTTILIPMILFTHKLYFLTSTYVMVISTWLLYLNINIVKGNFLNLIEMRKKLNNLEFYYITDENKLMDLRKRKNTYGLLQNLTMGTAFIFSINFFALHYFIQRLIGSSKLLDVFIIIFFSITVLLGYGGLLAGIVYKHTTKIYVLIPIFSGFVYYALIYSFINSFPNFFRLIIYLIITLLLYCILAYFFPVHILRNLNSKTVLISSFFTILATFFSQIFSFYAINYFKTEDYLLTVNSVRTAIDISDSLKNIFLQNTELIDLANYFIEKEYTNQITSMMNLIITSFTISYIIGGLLINQKIKKNRLIAKNIYRGLVKNPTQINYKLLIKCSFYGGEEYENLILNNNEMLKLIIENESDINISDVSSKKMLAEWVKKNFILYRLLIDLKEIFNIKNIF